MENCKSNREIQWEKIEQDILTYQKTFSDQKSKECEEAAERLIEKFTPLFTKYLKVIKRGEINFRDQETKRFVFSFISKDLRKDFPNTKKEIIYRFNFIVKTYGELDECEILSDIYEIFFRIAKRYKQMNRSFCGYVYNVFYHEMSRHIKKFIQNPINVHYRIYGYNDNIVAEDNLEDEENLLSLNWINGISCSDIFKKLSAIDRKILLWYYYNDQNDQQISEALSIHINTVNQRRRKSTKKILDAMPHNEKLTIKRRRKTNKKPL